MSQESNNYFFLLGLIAFCFFSYTRTGFAEVQSDASASFRSNSAYIEGLYSNIDVNDPLSVFRTVFFSLGDQVTVYPSENFFYYRFTANGQHFFGTIVLSAIDRDSGIVRFSYVQKIDRARHHGYPTKGGSLKLNKENGLEIKKVDDFRYIVSFENKNVIFNLYRTDLSFSKLASLASTESYIGPSFDESGLQFYLIFEEKAKHLFWILNEDEYVPEEFFHHSKNIIIGARTGFAFYEDKLHKRKILIGVDGKNVLHNNWYDGPFDQLPDNYVKIGKVKIQDAIELSYPESKGEIDKYGNYKNEPGVRVPIAPYTVYFSDNELDFVDECRKHNVSSEFYKCITLQSYKIPDSFESLRLKYK